MPRDFNRQMDLFDPELLGNTSIAVIGAGATGSHVVAMLCQMGFGCNGQGTIKVFDFDVVEEHNLQNQAFHPKHIGMKKVDALKDLIEERFEGTTIEAYDMKVTDQVDLVAANYVFLLTDTMSSRKEIYESCFKYPFRTDLMIETRMGLREGRCYSFDPKDPAQSEEWSNTLYSDEDAEVSACGTSMSIACTAHFLSAMAVSKVVHHFSDYKSDAAGSAERVKAPVINEVIFSLYPETYMHRKFGEAPKLMM